MVEKLKSARHHWWPEVLSQFWKNSNGCVHWLLPNGEERIAPPKNFGVIGNGHHIKFGQVGEKTPWDHSFESVFQRADDNFESVIQWLINMDRRAISAVERRKRFVGQPDSDRHIKNLIEGIVSLAIRSPMYRELAAAAAINFRGAVPAQEINVIIGMNMRHCQRMISDSIGTRGKFAVLYAESGEFIFGDGFYHNITSPSVAPSNPKILVALTPNISVLFTIPSSCRRDPRLSTLVLSSDEIEAVNHSVQTYASQAIFYRSERPANLQAFNVGRHQVYARSDNPIERLIRDMPGMPSLHAN